MNSITEFELKVKLPVPLEKSCKISIEIPKTLDFESLQEVIIAGMFGNERSVSFAIDADFCAIIITDACLSFRGNQAPAIFRLLSFKNPGYVIQSDDFKITFIDANENMIASTSSGLSYKTTPGIIKVGEWSVQNPTVGELS